MKEAGAMMKGLPVSGALLTLGRKSCPNKRKGMCNEINKTTHLTLFIVMAHDKFQSWFHHLNHSGL